MLHTLYSGIESKKVSKIQQGFLTDDLNTHKVRYQSQLHKACCDIKFEANNTELLQLFSKA